MFKAIKYLILENCIDVFFQRVFLNFADQKENIFSLMRQIYMIMKQVRDDQGIDIGSFEDMCSEYFSMYSYSPDIEKKLKIQLRNLQLKYPKYVNFKEGF